MFSVLFNFVFEGHLLYCSMFFYFLLYTDGDLRTFTLLFYVGLGLGLELGL